ncbi:Serine/threonine protein kinase [Frankineae bacterium MT45]|nr:Serine/threonine protein kinase [Frankineae bacterium MT45]
MLSRTRSPAAAKPSWRLDGYAISDRLGVGGSGEVWRARRSRDGRPVALKRIPITDRGQLRAAQREAALLATLDHPHVIRLHEVAYSERHIVLVLDLAAGGSLRDLLQRRSRLTVGEVASALAPIGVALAYAHQHAVVHGDVTPGNVLFTIAGGPLLADLGVARIAGGAIATQAAPTTAATTAAATSSVGTNVAPATGVSPVRSTAAYLDPLVARGGAPTAESDVYMLAATVLHALTGEPLWRASSPELAWQLAATGDLADLPDRLAPFAEDLAALVARGLSPDPQQRPSASEFALDLRRCGQPSTVELSAGAALAGPRTAALLPIVDAPANADADADADAGDGHSRDRAASSAPRRGGAHRVVPTAPDRPSFTGYSKSSGSVVPLRGLRTRRHGWVAGGGLGALLVLLALVALVANHPMRSSPAAQTTEAVRSNQQSDPDAVGASWLETLDQLREQAYATNDPDVFDEIYDSASLRHQDAALLASLAPPGCRLVGVSTTFTDVHAEATVPPGRDGTTAPPTELVVSSSASLAPSRLVCGSVERGQVPGQASLRLRTTLRRVGAGYRISAQTRL